MLSRDNSFARHTKVSLGSSIGREGRIADSGVLPKLTFVKPGHMPTSPTTSLVSRGFEPVGVQTSHPEMSMKRVSPVTIDHWRSSDSTCLSQQTEAKAGDSISIAHTGIISLTPVANSVIDETFEIMSDSEGCVSDPNTMPSHVSTRPVQSRLQVFSTAPAVVEETASEISEVGPRRSMTPYPGLSTMTCKATVILSETFPVSPPPLEMQSVDITTIMPPEQDQSSSADSPSSMAGILTPEMLSIIVNPASMETVTFTEDKIVIDPAGDTASTFSDFLRRLVKRKDLPVAVKDLIETELIRIAGPSESLKNRLSAFATFSVIMALIRMQRKIRNRYQSQRDSLINELGL